MWCGKKKDALKRKMVAVVFHTCLLVALVILQTAALPLQVPSNIDSSQYDGQYIPSQHDFHDGPIMQWDPNKMVFHRYAMSYTKCSITNDDSVVFRFLNRFVETFAGTGFDCASILMPSLSNGFGRDCGFKSPKNGQTVKIYTSTDLVDWNLVNDDAFTNGPSWLLEDSIIFRPAIVYNPRSRKYLLWLNRLPRRDPVVEAYRHSGFVVGVSDSPEGPFQFVEEEEEAMVPTAFKGGADFGLVYDEDTGDAFIAYGSWHNYAIGGWREKYYPEWAREGHQIAIEMLDRETFTTVAADRVHTTVTSLPQESPSFFKREKWFYIIHGDLCCFCQKGSDAKVIASRDPFGPYKEITNLNPWDGFEGSPHVRGQSSSVFSFDEAGSSERRFVWTADLWFSGGGLKGDDAQFFEEIVFDESDDDERAPVPRRKNGNEGRGENEYSEEL